MLTYRTVRIPTGSWCGDKHVELRCPSHWRITTHTGAMPPGLEKSQIEAKLNTPEDDLRLESIAKAHHKIAIVVDDHTRPTPTGDILGPLLDKIRALGVRDENVKVIVALGTHLPGNGAMMQKKMRNGTKHGIEILSPDCSDRSQYVYAGHSDSGIPLYVNRYFAEADVRIAVSGIYPHDEAGFSGGAKILIGVLGLETISYFHRNHGLIGRGGSIDNDFRKELEHFADILELDYSVNCIINEHKEVSDVYCGDFRASFRRAVSVAREAFATTIDRNADVVISNAYPLDTSLSVLGKSRWPFRYSKDSAYRIVLTSLCDCPGERVSLSVSTTETLVRKLKKYSGATFLKRSAKTLLRGLMLRFRPTFTRHGDYVVYVTHVEKRRARMPRRLDGRLAYYDWNRVVADILNAFGPEHPLHVSLFLYAPLLYPSDAA